MPDFDIQLHGDPEEEKGQSFVVVQGEKKIRDLAENEKQREGIACLEPTALINWYKQQRKLSEEDQVEVFFHPKGVKTKGKKPDKRDVLEKLGADPLCFLIRPTQPKFPAVHQLKRNQPASESDVMENGTDNEAVLDFNQGISRVNALEVSLSRRKSFAAGCSFGFKAPLIGGVKARISANLSQGEEKVESNEVTEHQEKHQQIIASPRTAVRRTATVDCDTFTAEIHFESFLRGCVAFKTRAKGKTPRKWEVVKISDIIPQPLPSDQFPIQKITMTLNGRTNFNSRIESRCLKCKDSTFGVNFDCEHTQKDGKRDSLPQLSKDLQHASLCDDLGKASSSPAPMSLSDPL